MDSVRISTLVKGDPQSVYGLLREPERFPDFMPQIKKASILWHLPPNRQISEWEVEIEGVVIHWKEEDTYDDEQHSIVFRVIEGDYRAEGRWSIEKVRLSETRVTVEATFDWGLTNLDRYVGPVLERKAKKNLTRMVAALRKNMRTRGFVASG